MSGIIFKNGSITDEQILALLKRDGYAHRDMISMEKAISTEFEGAAIARLGTMALILGKDIPHACSFKENDLSPLDVQLETLSSDGDILCFHSHSPSDSYAWSIFTQGKRSGVKSASAGTQLSGFSSASGYDKGIQLNDQGIIELVERFTGESYVSWISDETPIAKAYYK